MAIQVRETAAGKSVSAYVVLNKKGQHVATVNAHFSNSGVCTVDVWNLGDAACVASLATAVKTGAVTDTQLQRALAAAPEYYRDQAQREQWAAYDIFGLQQGRAGGHGYDKFAAALSGIIIDGHTMANHCGSVPEAEAARARMLKAQQKATVTGRDGSVESMRKAQKIGAYFTNYNVDSSCYGSLYFETGLKRLEVLGYRVISAI